MTDAEVHLVRSAQQGDRAAFEELVRRTSRLVFARLFLEVGDVHRAEDLLQETLLSAFRALGSLSDPAGFRPWLLRIAQNVAIDAARRDQRKKRAVPDGGKRIGLDQLSGSGPPPDARIQRDEVRHRVLALLRSLPEEYRLPITLRYLGGADYDLICMQLGLTNGSLRGLLHRGLRLLRDKLQQAGLSDHLLD